MGPEIAPVSLRSSLMKSLELMNTSMMQASTPTILLPNTVKKQFSETTRSLKDHNKYLKENIILKELN